VDAQELKQYKTVLTEIEETGEPVKLLVRRMGFKTIKIYQIRVKTDARATEVSQFPT
jgi:hypothetical protein